MLLLLLACASDPTDTSKETIGTDPVDSDEPTDTDGTTDSAETDDSDDPVETGDTTETAETGETGTTVPDACPASAEMVTFVADRIALADADVGVDFDGDGEVDNAAAAFASMLDPQLVIFTQDWYEVMILQLWGLEDWCYDDVSVGIVNAQDMDGDPTDNHTGTEPFDPGADVDGAGHARSSGTGALTAGSLLGTVDDAFLDLGFLQLTAHGTTTLSFDVTEGEIDGWVATSATADDLRVALESMGIDGSLVDYVLDLDTDGDGALDAMSGTFEVHGVPCVLDL